MQTEITNLPSITLEPVANTARWVAAARAHESNRADRLFNDPWAADLAGQEGLEWWEGLCADPNSNLNLALIPVRVRFFDDFLLRRTSPKHDIQQIVLVASGMDTRNLRLQWSEGTRIFELDLPPVLELKDQILSAKGVTSPCWHRAIGVDLEGPWTEALLAAGFDPKQRSIWLLEGILGYLSEASALRLLDDVTALAAPKSWLGCETVTSEQAPESHTWTDATGLPVLFKTSEPEAILTERGWAPTVVQPGEQWANYGRLHYPVVPRSVPGIPRAFLITAERI